MKKSEYLEEVKNICEELGFSTEMTDDEALKINTNLEKWIVTFNNQGEEYTQTILHHYNCFNGTRRRRGEFPDFHIQLKKQMTPRQLINYIKKHENKWKRPVFSKSLCKDFNGLKNSN